MKILRKQRRNKIIGQIITSFSNKRFRMGNITRDLEVAYSVRQRMGKAGNHHSHQPEEFLQRFQISAGQQCEKNPLRGTVKILRDFRLPPPCTRKLPSSGMLYSVGFHVSGQLLGIIFRGPATTKYLPIYAA